VTVELLARAQSGDGDAFAQLVEPYRRELLVYCYRFLGSVADAEDALQDTLLSAWQGLAEFDGRASVRTWLYRVATSRWLDAFRPGWTARLLPTRANGQPAFGFYARDPLTGRFYAVGLLVITLSGTQISAMTRFDPATLPRFGLPATLTN
jgi:DNA-directed RNA polymerase specialized sigma24 family protein